MKGIVIGSIVLCKMLVSEPNLDQKDPNQINLSNTTDKNLFAKEVVSPTVERELKENGIGLNTEQSSIDTGNYISEEGVEIVIGEVVDIVEEKKISKK
jgi:hypothetical protein